LPGAARHDHGGGRKSSRAAAFIAVAGGCSGFAYTFAFDGAPRATDQIFEGPGGAKVFVDPRSLKLLDGTVLDFDEDNLMATNFTLRNPHAKSTCGCGESFSV
jgi:iron-sulfur cluster assembly accessory protein